ncbi:MAG TPA: cell surface protein, partial [Lachnospiraceae bacterium]|nr:cell surface protein [Lachnospiraceae bacterium]
AIKINDQKYKVTAIAKNAFKNNKKLTKVTIGKNVKSIGKNAFKGCKNLKKIVVKTKKLTAKKVGSKAFKGINSKAVVKVPKGKVKSYKKIVKAKGAGKKVKITK